MLIENKLAGSLISQSVIGVGLNVNQLEFPAVRWEATSMKLLKGTDFSTSALAEVFSGFMESYFGWLKEGYISKIDDRYGQNMYMKDEKVSLSAGTEIIDAVIRGVNQTGELLAEVDGAMKNYGYHEAQILPSPSK